MIDDTRNPTRPKIPGIKRDYLKVPEIVDNVEDWICLQMNIPDNDEYIRMFYDLFDTWLGMWFNYQRTGDNEGARTAKIWRQARQTILLDQCTGDITVSGCNPTPIGSIIMWASTASPPANWLPCNGQTVAVATYPDLFDVIGYSHGGSGANFAVPDFRGRSPIGNDPTVFPVEWLVGEHYGELEQTLLPANLPPHTHGIQAKSSSTAGTTVRLMQSSGTGTNTTQTTEDGSASLLSEPVSVLHPVVGIVFLIRASNEDCEGGEVVEGPPGPPGPTGPPGPQGINGECEECGEVPPKDDDGSDVPPPIPGIDNTRCRVAQGTVDNLLDIYLIPLLDFYIETFITNGLTALEAIDALRLILLGQTAGAIFWPPSAIGLIGTIGSALFGSMVALTSAAEAQNNLDIKNELNDEAVREEMYCILFNLLAEDGDITADVWGEFLTTLQASENFAIEYFGYYLQDNIPLYAARTEAFITDGGDFDCAECGWCYTWDTTTGTLDDWTVVNGTIPGTECGSLEGTHVRVEYEFVTPVTITQLRWFISAQTSAFSPFRIYINDGLIWQGLIRNGEQGIGGNFTNVTKITMDGVNAQNYCVDAIRLRGKGSNPFGSSNCE